MKKNRSFMKRADIIIIGFLLLASIVAMLIFSSKGGGSVAVITVGDTVVKEIDLPLAHDEVFAVNENVSFEVLDHSIRFINVNCPDKLCENISFISGKNEVAVCMPNRTILKIR